MNLHKRVGVRAPAPRALPLEVRASFQQLSLGCGGVCLRRPVPSLSCATTTPAPSILLFTRGSSRVPRGTRDTL